MAYDQEVAFPMQRLRADAIGDKPAIGFVQADDAIALTVFLHKDLLLKRLEQMIDAGASSDALAPEAREKAVAEIGIQLLEVERREAALVWAAKEQGLPCEHRADASPQAILQCRLVTIPAVEQSVGSTPGMSWDLRR